MRSRLIKHSLPGLPRTNSNLGTSKSTRYLSAVWPSFLIVALTFLGLSFVLYSELHRFWYSRRSAAANSVLSRFTSKPPLVDRTILERIAGLDLEDETDTEQETHVSIPIDIKSSYLLSPFQRLPRVTRIPEARPKTPPSLEMEGLDLLGGNADHIPSLQKILIPLKTAELATSAHDHLTQLFALARALNRTLVLPNVGKNRVGACGRWRFGVYYDEEVLSRFDGSSNAFVRQDRFRAWVGTLGSPPSSQLVFLDQNYIGNHPLTNVNGQINDNHGIHTHTPDTVTTLLRQTGCFGRKFPQLNLTGPFPPLAFSVDTKENNHDETTQILLGKLSEPGTIAHIRPNLPIETSNHPTDYDATIPPDILIVAWNMPMPIFTPQPTTVLRYSPQLRALAARLVNRLGPYIAVTWDIPTSRADAILGCMQVLDSSLRHALSSHGQLGIRNIWLGGNLSPSSELLLTNMSTEQSFFLSNVRLTGVNQELEAMVNEREEIDDLTNNGDNVTRKQEVLKDIGILGILDKLVSMRSAVFITASGSCGETRCVIPFLPERH